MAVEGWYLATIIINKIDVCTVTKRDNWTVFTCIRKDNIVITDLSSYRDGRRAVFKYSYLTLAKVGDVANHCR